MNFYRYINEKDLNNYEKDNKILSYANLFYDNDNMILCNNIVDDWEYLTQENGFNDNDDYDEIFQYYIIDDSTAERLKNYTDEIIYYHNKLDLYILGVAHFGTNWHYVYSGFDLVEDEDKGYFKAIKHEEEETEDTEEDDI